MLPTPKINPAVSFQDALNRTERLQAADGAGILPQAHTALLHHGERTPLAVVLLHGFTNHPGQFREFAPLVFERGANVLIPRMPEHGDRDRLTRRLSRLTAPMLIEAAWEAADIAHGLGERVCVAGISSSGLLCAYLAHYRSGVQRSVIVAPEFAILDFSYGLTRAAALALRVLPDMFLWWDPRTKNKMHPLTAYPRFSTHALAQTLRIARAVHDAARREPPQAQSIYLMLNANDPAVNNHVSEQVADCWNANKPGVASILDLRNLPRNHDIIEPDNPKACTGLVYPRLLECIVS